MKYKLLLCEQIGWEAIFGNGFLPGTGCVIDVCCYSICFSPYMQDSTPLDGKDPNRDFFVQSSNG